WFSTSASHRGRLSSQPLLCHGLVLLRFPEGRILCEFAMRIVVHRNIPDDPWLQRQWNALVQEMESPEVFYTYQWASAVSRTLGDSLVPMLVLGYEGEKLTGVAALATDPAIKQASFLTGATADYCDLVSHPEDRAEMLDAVL